jgi:hypothetical protein
VPEIKDKRAKYFEQGCSSSRMCCTCMLGFLFITARFSQTERALLLRMRFGKLLLKLLVLTRYNRLSIRQADPHLFLLNSHCCTTLSQ